MDLVRIIIQVTWLVIGSSTRPCTLRVEYWGPCSLICVKQPSWTTSVHHKKVLGFSTFNILVTLNTVNQDRSWRHIFQEILLWRKKWHPFPGCTYVPGRDVYFYLIQCVVLQFLQRYFNRNCSDDVVTGMWNIVSMPWGLLGTYGKST